MISVILSFEQGKIIGSDPITMTYVWDHPVLDIGSSYSGLLDEVKEWLDTHCEGSWKFGFNRRTYELKFELEKDATLFRLRWL
jgi:hypothetical protein